MGSEMGKCFQCGRGARNRYTFYIGDVADKRVESPGGAQGPRSVTVAYDRITERREYLCKRCAYDDFPFWMGGFALCLLALAAMLCFLYIPNPGRFTDTWFFVALLLFASAVCLVRSRVFDYLRDARIEADPAAVKLILAERENTGDTAPLLYDKYLTPGMFSQLRVPYHLMKSGKDDR